MVEIKNQTCKSIQSVTSLVQAQKEKAGDVPRTNVETANDLTKFQKSIPEWITIIPKIESPKGIENIQEITKSLNYAKKYVMLDHDDLFSAIIKRQESYHVFQNHIKKLVDFCQENNISLLRTVGVIFSDDEKRTTQYVK